MPEINTPQKQMRQEILALAMPVLTEQAFITLMDVVNAIMAGHIGKEATAGVGMVDTLNSIFIAFFSALAIGGTVVVAHYTVQNNYRHANEASKQALYSGLILAVIITLALGIFRYPIMNVLYGAADKLVLKYAVIYMGITLLTYPLIALTSITCGILRGAGDTKTPAAIVIIMNIVNIIFSYVLIFGISYKLSLFRIHFLGLGVPGAALGIGIARVTGVLLSIYILLKGSMNIQLRKIYQFKPNFEQLKSILNIGIPASLESLFFMVGKLITQTFIVAMGTVPIVANYIAQSIFNLICVPGNAFCIAATALIGQHMGRGHHVQAQKFLWYLNKMTLICMIGLNVCCFLLYPFFVSLYTPNPEIIKLSSMLLWTSALFIPFWPISFILPAGLKGAGDVKYTLIVSAVSMWVFRITFGYILCIYFKFGALGVWLGMYADWIIRGIAFYIRLKGNRWQNHIVVKCLDQS